MKQLESQVRSSLGNRFCLSWNGTQTLELAVLYKLNLSRKVYFGMRLKMLGFET